MSYLIKPAGYKALLNLSQTEMGIKKIKDFSSKTCLPNYGCGASLLRCSF